MANDIASPFSAAVSGEAQRSPPLTGVRVIDLTQIYNGPYATFLMAVGGAEVIKVEPPAGEHLRKRDAAGGAALPFAMLNANKRSLVLDLKTAAGREALLALVDKADVLVENYTPGVMARLGLGWEVLRARNPRLIYAASSGYGLDGPYRDYPAMDLTIQAMSGLMSVTGFPGQPPLKAGAAVCDFFAGIHLYGAILTALYERERSGTGQLVEISMLEAIYVSLTSNLGPVLDRGEQAPVGATGNRHGGLSICPYNVYPTSDGFIAIICNNDTHWRALATALAMGAFAANPAYADMKGRVQAMETIDAEIGRITGAMARDALFARLIEHRVPCAPVRTLDEVITDPHLHGRGALQWIDHPQFGRLVVPTGALRLHGSPAAPYRPSPALGEESEAILAECAGLEPAGIQRLRAGGAF
jgi:CoA:oxalate CoA-transferase